MNGYTPSYVILTGTFNGDRCIKVLIPQVRLFRGAFDDTCHFMKYHANYRCTTVVQECLDSDIIKHFIWSSHSLDLNLLENV